MRVYCHQVDYSHLIRWVLICLRETGEEIGKYIWSLFNRILTPNPLPFQLND